MKEVVRFIIKLIFGLLYRVEITGTENIPRNGAALLCANHVGELDMFFIGYRTKRLVRWMAKEELFRNPIVAAFIRWMGAFPVKRGKGDVDAVKTALSLLNDGHIVGIFPEGTRTRGKTGGKISVKSGAALIASKAGVDILPVGIKATYKPFSKVKIVFGKPFAVGTETEEKLSREQLSEISGKIMNNIFSLLEG